MGTGSICLGVFQTSDRAISTAGAAGSTSASSSSSTWRKACLGGRGGWGSHTRRKRLDESAPLTHTAPDPKIVKAPSLLCTMVERVIGDGVLQHRLQIASCRPPFLSAAGPDPITRFPDLAVRCMHAGRRGEGGVTEARGTCFKNKSIVNLVSTKSPPACSEMRTCKSSCSLATASEVKSQEARVKATGPSDFNMLSGSGIRVAT